MTPDPILTASVHLWFTVFSAALAAIAVYDFIYVAVGTYRRSRAQKQKADLEATAYANAKAGFQTRMAKATDRKDPPIP